MSVQELKGGMLELIASVNNPELLEQLYALIQEVIQENIEQTDFWDDLTEAQQEELDAAIEESEQEENLVSHDVVMEKYRQWLSK